MRTDIFLWIATVLLGLGLWLLADLTFVFLTDLVLGGLGWLRRRLRPRLKRLLEQRVEADGSALALDPDRTATTLALATWLAQSRLAWVAAGALAAALAHDAILSPVLGVLLVVGGEVYRSQQEQTRKAQLNEDAGNLIVQFESRFPLLRSVTTTLTRSLDALPERELKRAARQAVQRLKVNQPPALALERLGRLPVPPLQQFVTVVTSVQETDPGVFRETLETLRRDVENRLLLHNQIRQSLTLVAGTTRILQGVLAAALLVVAVLPAWRYYFTSSTANWVMLLLALAAGTVSSLYVEAEIRQLEA